MSRGLLGSTLGVLGGRLTQPSLAFLLFFISACLLTTAQFGVYVLLMGLVILFQSLSSLGLGQILAREIGQRPEKEGILIGSALLLSLPASAVSFILFVLLSCFLKQETDFVILTAIVALSLPFSTLAQFVESVFTAHNAGKYIFYVNLAEQMARVALSAVALLCGYGLYGLAVAYVIGRAAAAAGMAWIFLRTRMSPPLGVQRDEVRYLLARLKAFAPMTFLANLYFRADIITLAWFMDDVALGLYGCAMRIVSISFLAPDSVVAASFPHVSARWSRGDPDFGDRTVSGMEFLLAFALLGTGCMGVFAAWGLAPVFGIKYAAAMPLLALLAFMLPAYSLNVQLGLLLQAVHMEKKCLGVVAAGTVLVFSCTAAGAVFGGLFGAALGTLVATWLCAAMYLRIAQPFVLKLPAGSPVWRTLGMTVAAAAIALLLRPTGVVAFCLVMAAAAWIALAAGGLLGALAPGRARRALS